MKTRSFSLGITKGAATLLVVLSVFSPIAPVFASGARLGDLNFDGITDVRDAQIAEEYANGKITLSVQQRFVGDVDEDGRVGRGDALVIMNYAVGLLPALPVKMGDVNGDGGITAEDGLVIEKFVNQEMSLTSEQKVVADVDLDQEITLADADLVMRRAVGSLASLPSYAPKTTGVSWIQEDWAGRTTGSALHGYTSVHGLRVDGNGDIAVSFTIPAGRSVGDINNDGTISSEDVAQLDRVLSGADQLTYAEQFSADVDGDKRITRADKAVFEAYMSGVVQTLPVQFGDLNKNGAVTEDEATRVLDMAIGIVTGSDYERFIANARVDGVVDARDAQVILEYAQGFWPCLPVLMEMRDVPCGNAANRIATGTMTSAIFDAGSTVEWQTASTTASFGGVSGSVELYVRAGDRSDDLGAFVKVENDQSFARIGRFAQYKVVMSGGEGAMLSRVALHAGHVVSTIRDLAPDCSVRGLYATYYNLPATHPDVAQGISGSIAGEANPFGRDWYELDKYFAFSRTDALTTLNQTSGFFPVNEGLARDPHLFATHWSGTLNASATSSYPFVLGSDDDAWMMIDGTVLLNLSGVHGFTTASSSMGLTPGLHTIDVFFAERREVESGIKIGIADNLGVSPCVAEPIFENHAPEITGPDTLTVRVGNTTHATLTATDSDGDSLTFTNTLPTGATFNENTGVFSWAPTTVGTYTAMVTVSDGELTATHTITITVLPPVAVNHAPIIEVPERIEKYLGNTADFTVTASDPDGDTLTATSTLPLGAAFDVATGAFTWTPTVVGEYTATFTYSDGKLSTTKTTTIVVTERVVVNHAPTISAPQTISGNAGEIIQLKVTTDDLDGDHVTLSANGVPTGAVFDAALGIFNWIPTAVGTTTLSWSATDGKATTTASTVVTVREALQCVENVYARVNFTRADSIGTGNLLPRAYVGGTNNPLPSGAWFPLYQNGVAINDAELEAYEDVQGFAIQRKDGDFRVLLHGSHEGGEGIGYPNREDAEGTIEIMKGTVLGRFNDETGNNKLETSDNVIVEGGKVTFDMEVTIADDGFLVDVSGAEDCVVPEQHAPVWTGPTELSGKVGDVLTATIIASDVDGDALFYTFELPSGATYSTSTGAFRFTSTVVGAFIAKLWVTDNHGAAPVLHTIGIAISPKDNPPGGGGGGGITPTTGGGGGGSSVPPTLEIYDIRVTDITNTSATVSWKSNFLGSSRVIYDTTCGGYNTALAPGFGYALSSMEIPATVMVGGAQQHNVVLTGLSQATGYCFRVMTTGTGQVISGEGSFATNGGFVPPPPVVIPPAVRIPAPVVPAPVVAAPVEIVLPEAPAPQTAAVSKVFPLPWWLWVLLLETVIVGVLALRARDDRARMSHVLAALLIPVGFIDWLGMTRATFVQGVVTLPWYIVGAVYVLTCAIIGWLLWEERLLMKEYTKRTRNRMFVGVLGAWIVVFVRAFVWKAGAGSLAFIDLLVAFFVALGTLFWIIHFGRETKADVTMVVGNEPELNFYTPAEDVSRITV